MMNRPSKCSPSWGSPVRRCCATTSAIATAITTTWWFSHTSSTTPGPRWTPSDSTKNWLTETSTSRERERMPLRRRTSAPTQRCGPSLYAPAPAPGQTVPTLDVTGKSASEQGSRHDDTKDLVGALIDLGDLRVAHH